MNSKETLSDIREKVRPLFEQLYAAGHATYLVGGAVRDLLRETTPKDIDLATTAHPEEILRLLSDRYSVIPTGIRFGTVTVLLDDEPVEITTLRIESDYLDRRRPSTVRFTDRIEEDLARRDFTINAMAFDLRDGRLIDPFGGRRDLRRGIVRAVGDPEQRFREDALRTLRAVRFAVRLGFEIEPKTLEAARKKSFLLEFVAWERIARELKEMLLSEQPGRAIRLLRRIDALHLILPEVEACWDFDQRNPHHADLLHEHLLKVMERVPARWPLRLAALLHDVGKPATRTVDERGIAHYYGHERVGAELTRRVCRRLRLSHADTARAVFLVRMHMLPPEAGPRVFRRLLREVGAEATEDLVYLREADLAVHAHAPKLKLRERLEQVLAEKQQTVRLAVNGYDVMQATGLSSSPEVGRILRRLQEIVDGDPTLNQRETLLRLLRREIDVANERER